MNTDIKNYTIGGIIYKAYEGPLYFSESFDTFDMKASFGHYNGNDLDHMRKQLQKNNIILISYLFVPYDILDGIDVLYVAKNDTYTSRIKEIFGATIGHSLN